MRELRFRLLIRIVKDGLDPSEALFVRRLIASTHSGDILELGSFCGLSSLSLYEGVAQQAGGIEQKLYCIEPHRDVTGVLDGQAAPRGRGGRIRTTPLSKVNLLTPANCSADHGWQRPLGLVFIHADNACEDVKEDLQNWTTHLIPGGLLVFRDAMCQRATPCRLMEELLASGNYRHEGAEGKVHVLRKQPSSKAPGTFSTKRPLRILVVASELYLSGGMLRFVRVARVLAQHGHHVSFCALQTVNKPPGWTSAAPVIDLEEAWGHEWDITMLPGRADFDKSGREAWLRVFTDHRFGVRMQHILNDRTFEPAFVALNRELRPHIVVFNNPEWPPGTFTHFSANEFHVLEGGVDLQAFAACHPNREQGEIVIGGQAQKNPWPLIASLDRIPENYKLRLFGAAPDEVRKACARHIAKGRVELLGTLTVEELPGYYAGLSAVVSTEEHAGWSNMTAEAMAAGVPVICTPAGTSTIAKDGDTALVIPRPDPAAIAEALGRLFGDAAQRESMVERARQKIQRYGWEDYASRLLDLANRGRKHHYYWAPNLDMFGKWPAQDRLAGLDAVFASMAGKTVLDVGSAEGLLARACLDAGASTVHGFDVDSDRIDKARALCGDAASFFVADLNQIPSILENDSLLPAYDIVLYLGVHHHLDSTVRKGQLRKVVAHSRELLALRTTGAAYTNDGIHELMDEEGFDLVLEVQERAPGMGPLWIYARR